MGVTGQRWFGGTLLLILCQPHLSWLGGLSAPSKGPLSGAAAFPGNLLLHPWKFTFQTNVSLQLVKQQMNQYSCLLPSAALEVEQ